MLKRLMINFRLLYLSTIRVLNIYIYIYIYIFMHVILPGITSHPPLTEISSSKFIILINMLLNNNSLRYMYFSCYQFVYNIAEDTLWWGCKNHQCMLNRLLRLILLIRCRGNTLKRKIPTHSHIDLSHTL
jgi:hypothetical protein